MKLIGFALPLGLLKAILGELAQQLVLANHEQ
jgi:hypothetical protein